MELQTNEAHKQLHTNEAHYAPAKKLNTLWTANKWRTLCNCKQVENIMQMQTKEAHYENSNKWSTLCNCKQRKHIMQLQTNEAFLGTANEWSTLWNWK
jgi:hypothetical protein